MKTFSVLLALLFFFIAGCGDEGGLNEGISSVEVVDYTVLTQSDFEALADSLKQRYAYVNHGVAYLYDITGELIQIRESEFLGMNNFGRLRGAEHLREESITHFFIHFTDRLPVWYHAVHFDTDWLGNLLVIELDPNKFLVQWREFGAWIYLEYNRKIVRRNPGSVQVIHTWENYRWIEQREAEDLLNEHFPARLGELGDFKVSKMKIPSEIVAHVESTFSDKVIPQGRK